MRSAGLRASCTEICSGLKMKGASFHVSNVSGCARRAKSSMKTLTTLMVLRKAHTSERSLHGPQLTILSTLEGLGMWPSRVQMCPTMVIYCAHNNNFLPEKVPPQ